MNIRLCEPGAWHIEDMKYATEGSKWRWLLVTGAGSGIGRAVALRFASEGASVAASDISLANARETARMDEETGGQDSRAHWRRFSR